MAGAKTTPRNLLVVRFSALGDVAMTIPVLYSVCRINPQCRFVMITRPSQTAMFVNPPANLVVEGIDLKGSQGNIAGLWRHFRRLCAQYDIDGLADLHGVIRTYALCAMAAVKGFRWRTINKGRRNKRALTRSVGKVMLPLVSSRARYREVFYALGYAVEDCFDGLFGADSHGDPEMFSGVTAPKAEGEQWVGIAPFAKHPGKIYPPELMERVVAALSERPGVKLFLFGGGDRERAILDRWAQTYPGVISLAGKRPGFGVELALMSHFDTMLSMDSANMHLASLVGVRVVSVWGATHPYCGFKGYRQRDADMVQLPMTCRPCSVYGNKPCSRGDYHCLSGIPPKIIVNKVISVLEAQK